MVNRVLPSSSGSNSASTAVAASPATPTTAATTAVAAAAMSSIETTALMEKTQFISALATTFPKDIATIVFKYCTESNFIINQAPLGEAITRFNLDGLFTNSQRMVVPYGDWRTVTNDSYPEYLADPIELAIKNKKPVTLLISRTRGNSRVDDHSPVNGTLYIVINSRMQPSENMDTVILQCINHDEYEEDGQLRKVSSIHVQGGYWRLFQVYHLVNSATFISRDTLFNELQKLSSTITIGRHNQTFPEYNEYYNHRQGCSMCICTNAVMIAKVEKFLEKHPQFKAKGNPH